MDSSDVARIVDSAMSVSDKIRALNEAGHPRADIARLLGKRYQHVRNVLEADKLHPPRPVEASGPPQPQPGFEEDQRTFGGVHRLNIEADGRIRLPPELLGVLQVRAGSVVIAECQDDGIKLFSTRAAWERARALFRQFRPDPERDLVAELIAERRAEAAGEERDD